MKGPKGEEPQSKVNFYESITWYHIVESMKKLTVTTAENWHLHLLHRIIESLRLEKALKIIESNHKPNTAKSTTKPCP